MANKVSSKGLERKDQFVYLDVQEADELEEGKVDTAVNIPTAAAMYRHLKDPALLLHLHLTLRNQTDLRAFTKGPPLC